MRRIASFLLAVFALANAHAAGLSPSFDTIRVGGALSLDSCTGPLIGGGNATPASCGTIAAAWLAPGAAATNLGASGAVASALTQTPGTALGFLTGSAAGFMSAEPFGAASDLLCAVDQTSRLQAWIDAVGSGSGQLPPGTYGVKSSLIVSSPYAEIFGHGANTVIKYCGDAGAPTAPVMILRSAAHHVSLHDLAFDGGSTSRSYIPPATFGSNPWGGGTVVFEGDDFSAFNLWGSGGFDNCFEVGAIDRTTNLPIVGSPQRWTLHNIHTANCGNGNHVDLAHGGPGKIGAGIDIGSGSAGVVSDVVDYFSYESFINDTGAGAQAAWSNFTSFYAKADVTFQAAHTVSGLFPNGIQPAIYAAGVAQWSNGRVIAPANIGIWSDYGTGTVPQQWANVWVKNATGGHAFYVKGPIIAQGLNLQDTAAPYNALEFDNSIGYAVDIHGVNINVSTSGGSTPAYSIGFVGSGAGAPSGVVETGALVGTNAGFQANRPSGLHVIVHGPSGLGLDTPAPGAILDVVGNSRFQLASGQTAQFLDSSTGAFAFFKPGIVPGQMNLGAWYLGAAGALQITGVLRDQGYMVAGLPVCDANMVGGNAFVTDSATPTWHANVSGGGTNREHVFCNGIAWIWQ